MILNDRTFSLRGAQFWVLQFYNTAQTERVKGAQVHRMGLSGVIFLFGTCPGQSTCLAHFQDLGPL